MTDLHPVPRLSAADLLQFAEQAGLAVICGSDAVGELAEKIERALVGYWLSIDFEPVLSNQARHAQRIERSLTLWVAKGFKILERPGLERERLAWFLAARRQHPRAIESIARLAEALDEVDQVLRAPSQPQRSVQGASRIHLVMTLALYFEDLHGRPMTIVNPNPGSEESMVPRGPTLTWLRAVFQRASMTTGDSIFRELHQWSTGTHALANVVDEQRVRRGSPST